MLRAQFIDSKSAGSFLADFYSHSLARALKMAFPEHDWLEWKFEVLPPRFFEQEGNAKRFCEYAASHLNINKLNDWERVTREQVEQILGCVSDHETQNKMPKS
jgi:hypothetical protein